MKFKYVKEFEFPADRGFRGSNKMPAKVGKASGAPKMESKPKVGKGQGFAEGGRVPGYDMDRLPAKKPPGRGMDLAPSKPFKGKYEGYAEGGLSAKPMTKNQLAVKQAMDRQNARAAMLAKQTAASRAARDAASAANKAKRSVLQPASKSFVQISDETGQYDPNRRSGAGAVMTAAPVATSPVDAASEYRPERPQYGMGRVMQYAKGGKAKIGKVMREYKEGKLHSGSKKGPVVKNEKQAVAIALSEARKAGAKIPKKAEGGIFNDEDMAYESKGPKTRYSAARSRRMSKERAMERRALDKARHAEKYAPGMSLDMADKKSKGGMPVHRRKPMYGGGKC